MADEEAEGRGAGTIAVSRVEQVKRFIIERIRSGELAAGARVESVRETTRITGVSHATVAAAFRALAEEGWILTQAGRGAFVASEPPLASPEPGSVDSASRFDGAAGRTSGMDTPTLYVVGGMPAPSEQSHHVFEILSGLQAASRLHGWQVTWCTLQNLPPLTRSERIVGIAGSDQVIENLPPEWCARAPFVYYGLHPGRYDQDAVLPDSVMGARLCTEHLLSLGHRRIVFVTGQKPDDQSTATLGHYFSLRVHGFREAMVERGLDAPAAMPWNIRNPGSVAAVRAVLEGVRDGRPDAPTALQVATDGMAVEVIELAAELGLQVPRDISVTGFGDWNTSSRSSVQLTTVKYDRQAMGSELVALLARRLEQPSQGPLKLLLPMALLPRESAVAIQRATSSR